MISNQSGPLNSSATINADGPIAMVVNHAHNSGGDYGMSYTGVYR